MAVDFDGSNDWIMGGLMASVVQPTAYTICAWAKRDTDGNIVCRSDNANSPPLGAYSHMLFVGVSGTVGSYTFDGGAKETDGLTVMTAGVWHHVMGTAENGGKLRVYLDGVEDNPSPASVGTLWTGGTRYHVAVDTNKADDGGYFDGQLDDLRVFHRVISAAEKKILAAGYRGPLGGEFLWYTMADFRGVTTANGLSLSTANLLLDRSPNRWVGTPTNSPVAVATAAPSFRVGPR